MKKFMLSLFFMVGIFVLASHSEMLWSNRLFLDEPRIHKIQKGEYLSQLAKRYYGDAQRWRELALVNRAPNPNLVLPGEEILVPAVGPVNELTRARTITKVKSLVGEQERFAVMETPEAARQFNGSTTSTTPNSTESVTPAATEMSNDLAENAAADGKIAESDPIVETPLTDEVEAAAGFPWFWLAVGVILIGGIFAFMRYRQRAAAHDENASDESSDPLSRTEEMIRDRRRHVEGATSQA